MSGKPSSHHRTQSREGALQVLYQIDLCRLSGPETIQVLLDEAADQLGEARPSTEAYMRRIVFGVLSNRTDIDQRIRAVAKNWDIRRMAIIDRNVLRIGAWELLENPDVPRAVAINEAIELARKFSNRESGTFVNGILDRFGVEEAEDDTDADTGSE